MKRNRLNRYLYITLGTVCVGLGIIGVFLPLLPTTPFLLLAAFCFDRGSERMHQWLITNRWLGAYIRNYHEHHGITRRHKVCTLLLLWGGIGTTAVFFVGVWWVRCILLVIATGVTVHILKIRTL